MRHSLEQAPVSGVTIGHKQSSSAEEEALSTSAELPENLQDVRDLTPQ